MDCKCKDCKKRIVGCHAKCPDYQEFLKYNEERKKRERNQIIVDSLLIDFDARYYERNNLWRKN